jgi:hypothetical protein
MVLCRGIERTAGRKYDPIEVIPMPKLYLLSFSDTGPPSERVNSWYTRDAEKVTASGALRTREEAELAARLCEQHGYEFTTAKGDTHVCAGFKAEECAGTFVVFCEAPFSNSEVH